MTIKEAIEARHSVRQYEEKTIPDDIKEELEQFINECNEEGKMHIQLVCNEEKAFDGTMAHYGKFSGVTNYIAVVGPKTKDLDFKSGYYGEKIVLKAQMLGLNTCWVALTFSKIKSAYSVADGEKLVLVISLGYGKTAGYQHKSKPIEAISKSYSNAPQWFRDGVDMAMLAPTAVNQQKFSFELVDDKVVAKPGLGFYAKVDLGIAVYHFEIGSGKKITVV